MVSFAFIGLALAAALGQQAAAGVAGSKRSAGGLVVHTVVEVEVVTIYPSDYDGQRPQPTSATPSPSAVPATSYVPVPTPASSTTPPPPPQTTLQTSKSVAPSSASPETSAATSAPTYGGSSGGSSSSDNTELVASRCASAGISGCTAAMDTNTNWGIAPNAVDDGYTFDVQNQAGEGIVIIVWAVADMQSVFTHQFVGNSNFPPAFVLPVAAGKTGTFSIAGGKTVLGAWSVLSSKTVMQDGLIHNVWGEYSMTASCESDGNNYSGIDVSKKILGATYNGMSMTTYDRKGGTQACMSDMDVCSYDAAGIISQCPAGALTTVDPSRTMGACLFARSSALSGYSKVVIT